MIAALAWCTLTLGLMIAGWPRGAERELLSKSPRHLRLLLFLPFSPWRQVTHPTDPGKLLRLRKLSLATSLALLSFPLLLMGDAAEDSTLAEVAGSTVESANSSNPAMGAGSSAKSHEVETPDTEEKLTATSGRGADGEGPEIFGASADLRGGVFSFGEIEGLPPLDAEQLAEIRTPKRLYGDAKVNPHYLGHDLMGVRIRNVGRGSFWHRMGLRNEDLIVEVNGTRIDNADATNLLLNTLADDYSLRLRVVDEDGEDRVLDFTRTDSPDSAEPSDSPDS